MAEVIKNGHWSRGALVAVPFCPMCKGKERASLGSMHDALRPADDEWQLWSCCQCQSVWLDPRPDDASIPAAYDFDYVTHRSPQVVQHANWLTSLIDGYLNYRFNMRRTSASRWGHLVFSMIPPLRLKLDYFGRHLVRSSGGRLLDVGCGNGDFVALAQTMGWEAEGVDPDHAAIDACRERGIAVTHGFIDDLASEKRSSYWSAITMSHSLEHVPDPRGMLCRMFDMLAPGGALWIALPNPAAIGARFYGLNWESYDVPRHLCLPSIDVLKSACREAGFEIVEVRRRGAHTGRLYRRSAEIARTRGGRGLSASSSIAGLLSLLTDTLATLSVRYAEENVVVARKSNNAITRNSV